MKTHPSAAVRTVQVRAEPIELCQLLKFGRLAGSGGEAKALIAAGKVLLNGAVETRKRKKVMAGDKVTLGDRTLVVALG
ncbi:MAG: RNA-binding S4 domain-containing protein [Opitutae bacterium]|nr:RNA-binding S4 domain-containing protein [Opitutae bacterium]